jgi:DNA-binding NtrC family response regulator
VRELENTIERAIALGSGNVVQFTDLPTNLQYDVRERVSEDGEMVPLLVLERRAIFRAMRETNGDKLAAARLLGIGKTTLYRKLKQYDSQPSN